MKITMEPTEQIVDVDVGLREAPIQARVWVGVTESGISCQVLVTRIAVEMGEDQRQFQAQLQERTAPRPVHAAFPNRLVL